MSRLPTRCSSTIPVRRPVHYMAWNALFRVPGLAWLIRRLRAFPVDIDVGRPAAPPGRRCASSSAGEAVMIFPEAGRSLDGRLERFKPGAFRLACSLGVPVMPVTIVGAHESLAARSPPAAPRPPHDHYHPVIAPPADGT